MGIATVFVTALPTIGQMVGANRVLRGVSITSPTGDPSLAVGDEHALRVRVVERALEFLGTDVDPGHRVGGAGVTGRDVAIVGASLTLQHVPDLVRYGSKPRREQERLPQIQAALRSFSDAVDYAPNQVFIGNAEPDILRDLARPWWGSSPPGDPRGVFGDIMDQATFYELLAELDQFELVRLKEEPRPGELPLLRRRRGRRRVRARARVRRIAHGARAAGEPGLQGRGRARHTTPVGDQRRRPDVDPVRDRCGRGGDRRSVPARRWQPRQGDRGGRGHHRGERVRHQGVLCGADPRSGRGGRARVVGRVRPGCRRRRRGVGQARHEVRGSAGARPADPRGRARGDGDPGGHGG